MLDVFKSLFEIFWKMFQWPVIIVLSFIGIMIVLFFVNYAYLRFVKGEKKPTGVHVKLNKRNFFLKLFVDAPRQMAKDYIRRNPEYFQYHGVIVYTGRQGYGKTIALVEHTMRMQREYPKCKVIGNLAYAYQDDELTDWRQLMDYNNGIQGVIVQMDEMQNWFSSNMSKDFPPQMLEVITQNRKNRRIILGTSQVFNRLSKPLREQATEERCCHTFAKCITLVIRKELFLDSEGNVEKKKYRGCYFFVHNDELREAYDTYKTIEMLNKSGFAPATPDISNNVNVVMSKKALRRTK